MTTRRRTLLPLATAALTTVLATMTGTWWLYANRLPVYARPTAALPSPNAYDDYVAAAGRLSADVPLPGRNNRASPGQRSRILAKNRPALARLRRGFAHPYRNPPLHSATSTLPELSDFRRLAGLLVEEGKAAAAEGRRSEAAESYLDCLRLGSDVPQGGTMSHAMTGVSIHELALSPLYGLADQLDAPSARKALARMRRSDATSLTFAQVLTHDRDQSLPHLPALLQSKTAEELGRKVGYAPDPQTSAMYLLTPKRRVLEDYRQYMDAWIRHAGGTFVNAPAPPAVPDDLFNRWVTPAYDDAWCWRLERDAAWRVLETRLAIRIYRLEHGGRAPTALSQLVPALLPSVPEDPFVGLPLIYRVSAGEPHVYSRGPDGDDDGDRAMTLPDRSADGDVSTMQALR